MTTLENLAKATGTAMLTSDILKGQNVEQFRRMEKFWVPTGEEYLCKAVARDNGKGVIYLETKIGRKTWSVSPGYHFDEVQDFSVDEEIHCTVVFLKPNTNISEDDLASVEAKYGASATQRYRSALAAGSVKLAYSTEVVED